MTGVHNPGGPPRKFEGYISGDISILVTGDITIFVGDITIFENFTVESGLKLVLNQLKSD